ncbi:MAG: hypothetical protein K2M91_02790, partial [Lachnospiraceae bacterium]|nr:hypothetical protein [Lachnospiraceae bacterium]
IWKLAALQHAVGAILTADFIGSEYISTTTLKSPAPNSYNFLHNITYFTICSIFDAIFYTIF